LFSLDLPADSAILSRSLHQFSIKHLLTRTQSKQSLRHPGRFSKTCRSMSDVFVSCDQSINPAA
jgi:hypothetical protein